MPCLKYDILKEVHDQNLLLCSLAVFNYLRVQFCMSRKTDLPVKKIIEERKD